MPKAHLRHSEWSVGRFLNWAAQIGKFTTRLTKHLLENKPHPEQGYRSCLGLLRIIMMMNTIIMMVNSVARKNFTSPQIVTKCSRTIKYLCFSHRISI